MDLEWTNHNIRAHTGQDIPLMYRHKGESFSWHVVVVVDATTHSILHADSHCYSNSILLLDIADGLTLGKMDEKNHISIQTKDCLKNHAIT